MRTSPIERKIVLDPRQVLDRVRAWRAAAETIVFANGCFDLLHVGHIRYLQGAAAEGDRLIVALNSDRVIRESKGEGRPVTPLAERLEIMAAFAWVDLVTFFDTPKCDDLIALLKPDVHAKGTEWRLDNVPERDTVLSYGGRIAIVGDPKNHSSSQLIRQLGPKKS
jgi:D-glycero-beta-D-manno-heptose 1-phosphate adenylyltransferase